jgi:hypothetical protein
MDTAITTPNDGTAEGKLLAVLALRLGKRIALLVTVVTMLLTLPVTGAEAAEPNRWDFLSTGPSTGVHAHLALGAASRGQAVYVSEGGSQYLDIIQVGAKIDLNGRRHLFAAWGRGVPNGAGSLYEERDLGTVGTGSHSYTLRLSSGVWRMYVDGARRLSVPDAFRTWTTRSTHAANEAEWGGALGGTLSSPVRISGARVWRSGAWRLPAVGYWYSMASNTTNHTCDTFGNDWLKVRRC